MLAAMARRSRDQTSYRNHIAKTRKAFLGDLLSSVIALPCTLITRPDNSTRNTRYHADHCSGERGAASAPPTAKLHCDSHTKCSHRPTSVRTLFALSRLAKQGDLQQLSPSSSGHEVVLCCSYLYLLLLMSLVANGEMAIFPSLVRRQCGS